MQLFTYHASSFGRIKKGFVIVADCTAFLINFNAAGLLTTSTNFSSDNVLIFNVLFPIIFKDKFIRSVKSLRNQPNINILIY
jgi:hypothetical protein